MEIYESEEYEEWIDSLRDISAVARIDSHFARWRLHGKVFGHVKPVGRGVSEVKFNFGPGYRVYFAQKQDKILLLLYGGDKSQQSKDIERAQFILSEYIQRKEW
ncbi:addiction module killer protein [Alloscardovia macacae]|uniref:Addiction module killer protein n=1 Tax=Alloscardovia macacae TaxID=1160091 RepID=A0A1Y2SZI3_9BIFI|nr:type II toxin-antitoxin system RelE/ParE family toxin [Alloscardovia macacae]OTA26459.1 addiction module killer protein [Alloscardovia macacae]OTA29861.1 addiction module killer protein [Alloscardovia macacae]